MNIYKRIGSLILSFVMILCIASIDSFAATDVILSTENKTVKSGEQFTFDVYLDNASLVFGGNFTLQYDSNLLIVESYEFGSIVSDHTKNCNLDYQSKGNMLRVTFSGASSVKSDGMLISFTFTAKNNVSDTVAIPFLTYKMYNENGENVSVEIVNSVVTISSESDQKTIVSVEDNIVNVGNTVDVSIKINNSSSVYGGNFTLKYDNSLLSAKSYIFEEILSEHTKYCNLNYQSAGNLIRVTFSGADAISEDGELVSIAFDTKSQGTASIEIIDCKMYDENGGIIDSATVNGEIEIKDGFDTGEYPVIKPDAPNDDEQASFVLTVPDKINVDDTFEVILSGENIAGLEGGVIALNYDSSMLQFVSSKFIVKPNVYTQALDEDSGVVKDAFIFTDKSLQNDADIIKYKFKALQEGECYIKASSNDWTPQTAPDSISIKISISKPYEYILGDINRDGKVTAADARIALRAASKLETLDETAFLAADVNADNKINAVDARKILRVAASLEEF